MATVDLSSRVRFPLRATLEFYIFFNWFRSGIVWPWQVTTQPAKKHCQPIKLSCAMQKPLGINLIVSSKLITSSPSAASSLLIIRWHQKLRSQELTSQEPTYKVSKKMISVKKMKNVSNIITIRLCSVTANSVLSDTYNMTLISNSGPISNTSCTR